MLLDIENREYKNYLETEILQIELIMNAEDESLQGCQTVQQVHHCPVLSQAGFISQNKASNTSL